MFLDFLGDLWLVLFILFLVVVDDVDVGKFVLCLFLFFLFIFMKGVFFFIDRKEVVGYGFFQR